MDFGEWVETVPERVRAESCWRFEAYPKALYLYELTRDDCNVLMRDARGRAVAKQLIRSAGSISANVEEGYGRGVGAKSTSISCASPEDRPANQRAGIFEPAACWDRTSSKRDWHSWTRSSPSSSPKNAAINPVTANTILHSTFSILGGALWPSCNTLS